MTQPPQPHGRILLVEDESIHPAARIGHAPARVRDEALARAEAADLLTALDEESDDDDAVANGTAAT